VCEEDVVECERDTVAHHLSLRAFAAIEQHRFALASEGNGGDVSFDSGSRRRCTQESQGERHVAEDSRNGAALGRSTVTWSADRVEVPAHRCQAGRGAPGGHAILTPVRFRGGKRQNATDRSKKPLMRGRIGRKLEKGNIKYGECDAERLRITALSCKEYTTRDARIAEVAGRLANVSR
jgi:hypothetical protein